MMVNMARTTVTLSDQAESVVRNMMSDRGIGFKAAINAAILEGAPPESKPQPFVQRTHRMGSLVPLSHATTLVGELEDIELIRKRDLGK